MSDSGSRSAIPEVDPSVAENYEALVADEARNLSYKKVADAAEAEGDPALAAWARKRAAGKGADVTPTKAEKAPDKVERVVASGKHEGETVEVDTVEPTEGVEVVEPVVVKPTTPAVKPAPKTGK